MKKSKFYRPDIDGLRALAIIPVILFHAGISGFSGGYIGVDIFFVISGYLISSIILRELREEKFSLVNFWERRVRRIVPVMFFISLVVSVAAYFIILFPVDFVGFGQSLVAQSFFLANIFFMRKDSYFAGPSESMPLLHMWTLSVEEQFYVLLPLLLLGVWWFAKKYSKKILFAVFLVVATLSFTYNIYLVEINAGGIFSVPFIGYIWGSANNLRAGFFFLPARAWEFLFGVLLATGSFSIKKKWLAEVLAVVGFVSIIYAITQFDSGTVFPGWAVLLPVLGSTFLILANTNRQTAIGTFLSFPVFVWVGLISYSLYLWHWPMIVFSKTLFPESVDSFMFLIIAAMFLLSWFSYRFVETPFRKKQICPKTWQMLLFGGVAIVVLASAGLGIHFGKGFPARASETAHAIAAATVDTNPREYECYRKNYRELFGEGKPCVLGDQSDTHIDFVLWGDSHSDSAMPIIDLMAEEAGQTGVYFGDYGCRPVLWFIGDNKMKEERCKIVNEAAVDFIKNNDVEKVLMVSAWYISPEANRIVNGIDNTGHNREAETKQDVYDAITSTVAVINAEGSEVYLMKSVPRHSFNVRDEFNKVARSGDSMQPIIKTVIDYYEDNVIQNEVIDSLESEGLIKVIDPAEAFCFDGFCHLQIGGEILYKNGGHINTTGSMRLRPYFEDFFQD